MLKVENLTIRFGGLVANNDITLEALPGKITGLIGPNGAGKTTCFNLINGVYKPNEGKIIFDGQEIQGKRPFQVNELGMARTYQVINLFRKLSVVENVVVGMHTTLKHGFFSSLLKLPGERREEKAAFARAMELLEFVGLKDFAYDEAGSLSYGNQRLLEICRGLASNPKLILLDEPAAGMNSVEKVELDVLLKKILDTGVGILLIEHDMKLVMNVVDYLYVLNYGKLLAEGTPEEIQNNPEVIAAYLGED